MRRSGRRGFVIGWICLCCAVGPAGVCLAAVGQAGGEKAMLARLDAPLLFVKRHNYRGIHIYDTFYKWGPGGGIYIIENPSAPAAERKIRPLVDPTTPGSPGGGIYSDPELSWDARRVLFCHKPTAGGSTSIYEIGIDPSTTSAGSGQAGLRAGGRSPRRLTNPTPYCVNYKGSHSGVHDVSPAYLPDGRIVFTSTRQHGLVPCANEGVDILHVMNADGSDIHAISVNNVNEFDPAVLPDGRILLGRWEYVDKTALTQQSLWTVFPDGTNETALFANNMVHPEAILDARPVPGSPHLVVGTFTPHNSPPRGSIGMVDPYAGKNAAGALLNFEHHDKPTYDRGNSCEPWPLSKDLVVYSGRAKGHRFNAILMIDRAGRRAVVHSDPKIDLHSPMLVKPRPKPPEIVVATQRKQRTGRFFVKDVYQGLDGVKRGEVTHLRVIEETSRVTGTHGGAYNQTFLMSGVLAWSAKNFLGVVPVESDGSAYFEVPSGRAVYLQALDAEGRMIRGMRTFVQAAPGVTRSCVGCHEYKYSAPPSGVPTAMRAGPRRLQPESWGSGYVDYPSMVQPILDKHCVGCHGGEKGFAGRLDLSGGWTEHFNISYENLTSRRHTQLVAHLISGIDCMNATSYYSARIFKPRGHGSGSAPLAKELISGHKGRIKGLSRAERDLILAWIDTNGLYHGTWNYTKGGSVNRAWKGVRGALAAQMKATGCMRCHNYLENDWINLKDPELSRILRAPLAKGAGGMGAGLCRDAKVNPRRQRLRILWRGYGHAAQPNSAWPSHPAAPKPPDAKPVVTFASTEDPRYQRMLETIRDGRRRALAAPRTDMPGAKLIAAPPRRLVPQAIPDPLPALSAEVDADGVVRLSWERSARTIGLSAELHRGAKDDFAPTDKTRIAETELFCFADAEAEPGPRHYALRFVSGEAVSEPIRASVTVPPPAPPPAPTGLDAKPSPGSVSLTWKAPAGANARYHVYRAEASGGELKRLTGEPIAPTSYRDSSLPEKVKYDYVVRAVSRRGAESAPTDEVTAAALGQIKSPLFAADFARDAEAALYGGGKAGGRLHGKARAAGGALDLTGGGYATFGHRGEFDLSGRFSLACRVKITKPTQMPVVVSCGAWNRSGWFLQRIGPGWRWHVGGIDCDGGKPVPGEWTHLVCTYDGRTARLYQDGRLVAQKAGRANRAVWPGRLHVGQYSGGPAADFQVFGHISGLKIYGRVLSAKEAAAK